MEASLFSFFGFVIFVPVFGYLCIVIVGSFLPPLDCSVGHRADRTIYNNEGNYSATFLKTGNETSGAYELVQVELEP